MSLDGDCCSLAGVKIRGACLALLFPCLVACRDSTLAVPDAAPDASPEARVPCIHGVSPASGRIGDDITLTGEFGDTPRVLAFANDGGVVEATVRSWSPTQVVISVPTLTWGSHTILAPSGCV